MRALFAIVVLAALGWSGWWYWAASTREAALVGWLDERRAAGWVAEAEDITVNGFPNRVDAIVTALELADPRSGWSWTAEEFQVLSLSYKPHHVIAVWPGEQIVASPYETTRIQSELMRGSVVFDPRPGLPLNRSTIEIEGMQLTGDSGWTASLAKGVLATKRSEPGTAPDFSHDVGFRAEALTLPSAWTTGIERAGLLPSAIEAADLDATLVFDRPWDQRAIEAENPVLERVSIRDMRLLWGSLDLRARGELTTDARGYAEGRLDLRARNWREMLRVAVNAGMIGENMAGAVETGLGLLARLSSDRNTIEVPLAFQNGETRLGPIVIGEAPRLARRY
jgi:hypothetical protein